MPAGFPPERSESGRGPLWGFGEPNEREARFALADQDSGIRPLASSLYDAAECKLLMLKLGERAINELHVEAGHKLHGSLLREGCVDELLMYIAPNLLGNAMPMFNLVPPATLDERTRLVFHSVDRIGNDLRIVARLAGSVPRQQDSLQV